MDSNNANTNQGLLPNFCDVTVVFMLALLVELFALVLALAVPSEMAGFWEQLALISLFCQWLGLLNAALLCLLRKSLNKLTMVKTAIASFILMMLVTLILSLLVITIGEYLSFYSVLDTHWHNFFLVKNLSISALVYIVVLRYLYIQAQWKLNLQTQSHAQIQALKARIRPHFLFNSMNTIASLIQIDAAKAEKAVEDLSDMFRASLMEKTTHTLAEEIALTRSYLDIETLRLGDRLETQWLENNVDTNIDIPALCLQPLVENAIYHGIEPMENGGLIKIKVNIENNSLCLSVTNPISDRGRMNTNKSNHMAQENIRKRLSLLYGDKGVFEVKETGDQYTVTLGIPLKHQTL
ncbi:MAG: histidine kinase [Gammaproteobacteria bacterium]|nr:histidine kinase [Gammaproteobacteria bacterium]MCW8909383.1 histidine kinase [Gammaproteobacteria bacterium]MCW9004580.1 histidine kinase [Gammaproteobacteria bacterium]MCW9056593.1 histidine kinase [Gammaproteobacteria bacterium]